MKEIYVFQIGKIQQHVQSSGRTDNASVSLRETLFPFKGIFTFWSIRYENEACYWICQSADCSRLVNATAALRRSLTWDQDAEMAQHAWLKANAGVQVYFCEPQSPWQRRTNENTNGLLHQYFPKGTEHRPVWRAAMLGGNVADCKLATPYERR